MTVEDIGYAAGQVWDYLWTQGPVSISRVTREVEGGQRLVLLAMGWLAREGKLEFREEERRQVVQLVT